MLRKTVCARNGAAKRGPGGAGRAPLARRGRPSGAAWGSRRATGGALPPPARTATTHPLCKTKAVESAAASSSSPSHDPKWVLSDLLEALSQTVSRTENLGEGQAERLAVGSLSHDSRDVRGLGNCVYFCLQGLTNDGHSFAQQAAESGAVAIVASKPVEIDAPGVPVIFVEDTQDSLVRASKAFFGDPSSKLNTVAVTGTNGKTTTTWLVRGILEEAGFITGMIGTVEYGLAEHRLDATGEVWEPPSGAEPDPTLEMQHTLPAHIVPYVGKYEVENTTPDALRLQQIMAAMVRQGGEAVVMEASSHALELGRCDGTRFNLGIFTNLTRDHMDFHRDMASYTEAKLKLFELVAPGGSAIVNLDDPSATRFVEVAQRRGLKLLTFSADAASGADVTCLGVTLSLFQTEMIVGVANTDRQIEITSSLLGRANVQVRSSSSLCSFCTLQCLHLPHSPFPERRYLSKGGTKEAWK